jgi:hypothetical protein
LLVEIKANWMGKFDDCGTESLYKGVMRKNFMSNVADED